MSPESGLQPADHPWRLRHQQSMNSKPEPQHPEEERGPTPGDEERPKVTCAGEAVTVSFLCGGGFVKLLTLLQETLSICSPHGHKSTHSTDSDSSD